MSGPNWKPLKGAYVLERKRKQREHKAREASVMAAVKAADEHRCRVPGCRYRDVPVDVAHVVHRGMGGNPSEDRTVPELLQTLCRIHHSMFDRGDLHIEPLTRQQYRGPCAYYQSQPGDMKATLLGVESRRVESVTRSVS